MSGDEKPKNKRRRVIRIAGSAITLAIMIYIAIALISGRGLSLSRLTGVFSKSEPLEYADEYHFDVGRDRIFTKLGRSLAAVGTLGIQVLDAGGEETLRDPFRMTNPAICEIGGRAIVFDIGGTTIRVISETDAIVPLEANGAIIAASINKNGWFCVCAQESGGFKGTVDVYNDKGSPVYKVRLESGYVLSAAVSPDNKSLAILNLADDGSRITVYNLSSETPERVFDMPGGLIIDIRYLAGDDLLVVSTDSLLLLDKNGVAVELYSYYGSLLSSYSIDGGFIALHLLEYGVGFSGWLVTLGVDGKILGELSTDREIISISADNGILAVLRSDGLALLDSGLGELLPLNTPGLAVGAAKALVLDSESVLAAGDHSALVIRVKK